MIVVFKIIDVIDKPRPAPGQKSFLSVESVPGNAEVFVDDESKGRSPVRLGMLSGEHDVRLKLEKYHEWKARVNMDGGEMPLFVRLLPVDDENVSEGSGRGPD